jgi:hypothetical protein
VNSAQEHAFWDYYYDHSFQQRFADGLGLEPAGNRVQRLTKVALDKFTQGLEEGLPTALALDRAFSVMRRSPREEVPTRVNESDAGEQE